jgi:hypothetical protein
MSPVATAIGIMEARPEPAILLARALQTVVPLLFARVMELIALCVSSLFAHQTALLIALATGS